MLISPDAKIIETVNSQVIYEADFVTREKSKKLFEYLLKLNWQNDTATIYGKKIITKRQIVWMAEKGLDYNYSGNNRVASGVWDAQVFELKQKLEAHLGCQFNSCLLNLYPTGGEGMAFHSDDQNHLEPNSAVAIISLGCDRFLKFRPNPKLENLSNQNPCKILLQEGSLVVMERQTQKYWQHEIPKMGGVKTTRISLTFRQMLKKS